MACCLRNVKLSFYQYYPHVRNIVRKSQSCTSLHFGHDIPQPVWSDFLGFKTGLPARSLRTAVVQDELSNSNLIVFNDSKCGPHLVENIPDPLKCRMGNLNSSLEKYLTLISVDASHDLHNRARYLDTFVPGPVYTSLQMTKQNMTVHSGFLDSSQYVIYCLGSNNKQLPTGITLSELEKCSLQYADTSKPTTNPESTGKPSEEQLAKVLITLADVLPQFFTKGHNFTIYHKDLIFKNNIRGVTTKGISAYAQQLSLARMLGHLRFSHVKVEILKITQHPEDGSVRVRWRVVGVGGLKSIFMFWRYQLWQWKKMMQESHWIDGFSIFYVGSDGLVHLHTCDKMMPDSTLEPASTDRVPGKLAGILGLVAQSDMGALYSTDSECPSIFP